MVDSSAPPALARGSEEVARVLQELTKMEQRYDAVVAVIRDGLSVTEVAGKFGVSRQSVYRWMSRYEGGGLGALGERSHRPGHRGAFVPLPPTGAEGTELAVTGLL